MRKKDLKKGYELLLGMLEYSTDQAAIVALLEAADRAIDEINLVAQFRKKSRRRHLALQKKGGIV